MECRFEVIARTGHTRLADAGLQPGDPVPIDLFCDLGHVIFSSEGNVRAFGDAARERIGRERRVVMTMPYILRGVPRRRRVRPDRPRAAPIGGSPLAPILGLTVYKPL